MKVTKQHKVLAGILVLGGLAVGMDRLVFLKESAPQQPETPADYAVAAPTAQAAHAVATTPVVSLAQRLRQAAERASGNTSRDAFCVGPAWPTPAKATPADNAAEQFRQSHRLTGVVSSAGRAHAMIDGKIVAVGQVVDGYRLASIEHRTVTFEANDSKVVLNMVERSTAIAGAGQ